VSQPVARIVVVGGGSAGWLTAGVIAAGHRYGDSGRVQVTVVESPDVRTIGVGEGTWPSMRDTLRRIGVSETDFIRACDASFKQGSQFVGWVSGGSGDQYFHPFALPQGYTEADLVAGWQAGYPDVAFADLVSYQPHLCRQGRAPKQVATPEFAAVANYAYHLDAGKFGEFLRAHCTGRLGVRHVLDHVTGIAARDGGDIDALETRAHGRIAGDLFIDCTGFASLLLGGHYEVPFVHRKDVLFNDSALAVQVPYPDERSPIESQTIGTAQDCGWIWDIGLPTRRGIGHVYSSAHTTDEQAGQALQRYVERAAGAAAAAALSPRKLGFSPGHRARFWHRNCVAVGMAAGFIEPLEASALALIELSATMISDQLPVTRGEMDTVARRFNDSFAYRWDRIVDFLKLHYVLTRRRDTEYWRDNCEPATIPERLRELLSYWRHHPPSRYDLPRVDEIFPSASYQYVLYGMGFRPEANAGARQPGDAERAAGFFRESAALARRLLAGLPANRELLEQIGRHGLQPV
jgi:tryptophan 7-halogenase